MVGRTSSPRSATGTRTDIEKEKELVRDVTGSAKRKTKTIEEDIEKHVDMPNSDGGSGCGTCVIIKLQLYNESITAKTQRGQNTIDDTEATSRRYPSCRMKNIKLVQYDSTRTEGWQYLSISVFLIHVC